MRLILFGLLILSIIFAQWVGIGTTWLMSPIANNNYGSILLLFALLYLLFEVTGISRIDVFHRRGGGGKRNN